MVASTDRLAVVAIGLDPETLFDDGGQHELGDFRGLLGAAVE